MRRLTHLQKLMRLKIRYLPGLKQNLCVFACDKHSTRSSTALAEISTITNDFFIATANRTAARLVTTLMMDEKNHLSTPPALFARLAFYRFLG
mmetsp:Transcript_4952/g.9839  ORF Transcript_4952/g.9839 Transcript_4952/m.9839 type:complete len:93 (+) Transcript_4952:1426-1704(+)